MTRETKQDRVVRGIQEQVTEHLFEMKSLASNPDTRESDVERWCQSFMKACLGYTASAGYTFRVQETKGKMRPDLILALREDPICVVEVKKLNIDLNKSDLRSGKIQLKEYLRDYSRVRWGFLTNGFEWRLFDFSDTSLGGVSLITIDLRAENGELDFSKRAIEDLCYELTEIHESKFGSPDWEQLYLETTAFSPDSLARAILSVDVVKVVAKKIRGEHDYKANLESLYEKLNDLVTKGLNDADTGWNENKKLELHKFTRAQVKSARRKRRTTKRITDIEKTMPSQETAISAAISEVPDSDDDSSNVA